MHDRSQQLQPTISSSDEEIISPNMLEKVLIFGRDIKLSHTIFALPWALLATFLSAGGTPHAGQIALIILCMIFARTVAMTANRLLDANLDAQNPRTARRAIPAGVLSRRFAVSAIAMCAAGFIVACAGFGWAFSNWLPLICSVPVLLFLSAYPLLKRFSAICHYYLGAALALAPVCAWIAIRGSINAPPLLMAGAVLLWTAGFDIIYACQDYESDVRTGTFSVPARLGIASALWLARLTHVLALALIVTLALSVAAFGPIFYTAVLIAATLLVVEHSLVRADDLSKVGMAFFTINGIISLVIGTLGIIDVYL